jgi:hypothetical protein
MLLRDVKLIMHAIKTDTDIEATPALLLKKRATARVHQLNQVDQGQYSSRVTTPVKSVRPTPSELTYLCFQAPSTTPASHV